jgi:hypothetical protein
MKLHGVTSKVLSYMLSAKSLRLLLWLFLIFNILGYVLFFEENRTLRTLHIMFAAMCGTILFRTKKKKNNS